MRSNRKMQTIGFCLAIIIAIATPAIGAERKFLFDFENGQDLEDVFGADTLSVWNIFLNHIAITDNNPHSGMRCIRGNLGTIESDPITGLPATQNPYIQLGGQHCNYGASHDIDSAHSDKLYISFWWRWDPGVFNAGTKLIWNQGIYCGAVFGDQNCIGETPPGSYASYGGFPYSWVFRNISKTAISGPLNDGEWHQIEEYFVYNTGSNDDGLFWVRVDGVEVFRRYSFASPGARLSRFSFAHDHPSSTGLCLQQASEGFQIDDIELWDGLPPRLDNDQDGIADEDDPDDDNDGVLDTADAFPFNAEIHTTERLAGTDNNPENGTLSVDELAAFKNRWLAGNPQDNVQYEEVQLAVEWFITGTMPHNWDSRIPMDEKDDPSGFIYMYLEQ